MNSRIKKTGTFLLFALSFFVLKSSHTQSLSIANKPFFSLRYKTALVRDIAFSPHGKILATAESTDNEKRWSETMIRFWDLENGSQISGIRQAGVKKIIFSPDGKYLVSTANVRAKAGTLSLWDVQSAQKIRDFASIESTSALAISGDSKYLAFAGTNTEDRGQMAVHIWNLQSGALITTLYREKAEAFYPGALRFSTDKRYLYIAVQNRMRGVQIWDWQNRKLIRTIQAPFDVNALELSPDGTKIYAGLFRSGKKRGQSSGGLVFIYDSRTGKKISQFGDYKGSISSLSLDKSGRYLAVSLFSGRPNFIIQDLLNQKEIYQHQKGVRPAWKAGFSPDSKHYAVVLNTYGNIGNPVTLEVYQSGNRESLLKSSALNTTASFSICDRVEAKIDGTAYQGIITKKSSENFLLKMDQEKPKYWYWARPQDLRLVKAYDARQGIPDLKSFKVGDRVKVNINGKSYYGVVHKTSESSYLLKMEQARPEYRHWAHPCQIQGLR